MSRFIWLLLLTVVLLGAAGCASTEDPDDFARPWNTPRNWETGLPSGMYEQR